MMRAGRRDRTFFGILRRTVCILALLASAGCGDRGGGHITTPGTGGTENSAPTANAGSPQSVPAGFPVTLDGSQSSDPDGNALLFAWNLDARPSGSNAVLTGSDTANPAFTPDVQGTYTIHLVVSDGNLESNTAVVVITATNSAPVAHAGPDQNVTVGSLITLDGSASSDPNGNSLAYSWMIDRPVGSAVVLSDDRSVQPTFTPDVPGTYTFYLTVYDGAAYSDTWDKVLVNASLTAVADAGPDQYHATGPFASVTLDGSHSYDTAGKSLTYSWSFTRRPNGSAAILSDPAAAKPSFTPDREGIYDLRLVMLSNGYANSLPDNVRITVVTARPTVGLSFKVIDAEYSRQLDRIIMVSGQPSNQLHIYDPVAGIDQAVALSALPTSVSISPDGMYAAVGHAEAISHVDLVSKAVATTLPANANVTDVVLGGNGYVYAFHDLGKFFGVNVSTGAATAGAGYYAFQYDVTRAKLHPSGSVLYVAVTNYTMQKYDITSGTPVFLYDSYSPGVFYTAGGELWMLEDGTGFVTRNCNVFSANTGTIRDLRSPRATLEGMNYSIGVQNAADSSAAAKLATIPGASDTEVRIFDDKVFTLQSEFALPHFSTGTGTYPGHGKFVFFNSSGDTLFVVVQADAAAGLTNDFVIVTYK